MTTTCLCQWCAAAKACHRRLIPELCAQTCPPSGRDCAVDSCPDYEEKQGAPVENHGSTLPLAGSHPAENRINLVPIIAQCGAGGNHGN